MAKVKGREKDGVAVLDQSPSHLLHRALQVALDIYTEEMGPGAVTQRQYAVLAAAAAREGATQTDLVRITGIDRSTLADMVARMLAKGLLERERSALDARANAVRLTEQGRAILAETEPKMAAADARVLKLLPGGGKRSAFVSLLQGVAAGAASPKSAVKPPKPEKVKAAGKKKKKARKAAKAEKAPAAVPELLEA